MGLHRASERPTGDWRPDGDGRFEARVYRGDRPTGLVREVRWDHDLGPGEQTTAWVQGRAGIVLHWHLDRLSVAGPDAVLVDVPVDRCVRADLVEHPGSGPEDEVDLRLVLDLGPVRVGETAPRAVLVLPFPAAERHMLRSFQANLERLHEDRPARVHRPGRTAGPPDAPEHGDRTAGGARADHDGVTHRPPPAPAEPRDPRPPDHHDTLVALMWTLTDDRAAARPRSDPTPTGRGPVEAPGADPPPAPAPARVRRSTGPPALPRLRFDRVPDTADWLSFAPRADSDEVVLPHGGPAAADPAPADEAARARTAAP
jgi:hypothetical protein